jgi:hypothetical protein
MTNQKLSEDKEYPLGQILSTENAYGAGKFSDVVDVHVSKLRRWSIELEKMGYELMRDELNKRIYLDTDIEPFLKLKEFIEEKNLKAEDAYKSVAGMFGDYKHRLQTPITKPSDTQNIIKLTTEELQEMLNKAAKQAVEETTEKLLDDIEQRLNKRETLLVNSLKESLKTQQQTQLLEHSVAKDEKKKKNWFQQIVVKMKR